MQGYKHSINFAQLKGLTEAIQGNHTSAQYVEVMDFLLYSAIEPVATHTTMYTDWLPQILAWYNTSSSRKISSVDKQQLQTLICMYALAPPDKRMLVIRRLRMERKLLALVIDEFLKLTAGYRYLVERCVTHPQERPALLAEAQRIERSVGMESGDLYACVQHVHVWYSYYIEFRSYLVEKFTRHALMKAKETYVVLGHQLDLDDIIQHYLMAIGKAIDKFDVGLGSLASYVGQWFLNARTVCRKELGSQHESLDALSDQGFDCVGSDDVFDNVSRGQSIARVQLLAKIADPIGLARLFLGIDESVCKVGL